ncbi:expressed unknown protein [Seminavis robusta]|uniref:S-adenosyl-L-methionine-dependent methyltransferase n=1 Tax=Seminavis robusta TaxID=568900 RepID=A0A9N8EXM4_9STRA|nr:expressed unknown protein [Seminavis robusta]|eukprot:Sro2404_g326440.1 n/a (343) ;mRNA; f:6297-7325
MNPPEILQSEPPDSDDQETTTRPLNEAEEVAARLGVKPTNSSASPRQRQRAYYWFRRLLTVAQLFDPIPIPNSFVNYQCVWWKAISGNDKTSVLQDHGLAYDLLPPVTRWAVASPLAPLYPRFHHGNVELRTKYLDTAVDQIIQTAQQQQTKKQIRLVLMGGGYDLRSLRMAQLYPDLILDLVEMDLPHVVDAKKKLFHHRLLRRRPELSTLVKSLRLLAVDLNDLQQVQAALLETVLVDDGGDWFTVFVFEAVLIYLDKGIPSQLFATISSALRNNNQLGGALCFADTLSNVEDGNEAQAKEELKQNGWDLQDWITKPGRTKHLGWALLSSETTDHEKTHQ